ncbi:MAG: radical SAM protein [Bacilli bacterium]
MTNTCFLLSLPSFVLDYVELSNVMLKGYLNNYKIKSHHFDLTIKFIEFVAIKKNNYKIIELLNLFKNNNDILSLNNEFYKELNFILYDMNIYWDKRNVIFKFFDYNSLKSLETSLNKYNNHIFNDFIDYVLEEILLDTNIDILVIPVNYEFQIIFALKISEMFKIKFPDKKIILWGNYLTNIKENHNSIIRSFSFIDAIVSYSYYEEILNMINYFRNNGYQLCNSIINIGNKIEVYNKIKIKFDYDNYVPCFDDIDLNSYLTKEYVIPLTISHGCHYAKCKFCAHHYVYNSFSNLNIKKIYNEIFKLNMNQFNIIFLDECIEVNQIKEMIKLLKKDSRDIKWIMETRFSDEYQSVEFVNELYKSGCRMISFGFESYDQKVLKSMNKGINIKLAKKVLEIIYKSNIIVSSTFMIGYPNEKIYQKLKTLFFLINFKYIDIFGIGFFKYVKNSPLCSVGKTNKEELRLVFNKPKKVDVLLLNFFYMFKKNKDFLSIRNSLKNRIEYIMIDICEFSINRKKEKNEKKRLFNFQKIQK